MEHNKLTSHAKKMIAAWQRGDDIDEEELYQLILKIDELDDDLALELGYVSKCYYRG